MEDVELDVDDLVDEKMSKPLSKKAKKKSKKRQLANSTRKETTDDEISQSVENEQNTTSSHKKSKREALQPSNDQEQKKRTKIRTVYIDYLQTLLEENNIKYTPLQEWSTDFREEKREEYHKKLNDNAETSDTTSPNVDTPVDTTVDVDTNIEVSPPATPDTSVKTVPKEAPPSFSINLDKDRDLNKVLRDWERKRAKKFKNNKTIDNSAPPNKVISIVNAPKEILPASIEDWLFTKEPKTVLAELFVDKKPIFKLGKSDKEVILDGKSSIGSSVNAAALNWLRKYASEEQLHKLLEK